MQIYCLLCTTGLFWIKTIDVHVANFQMSYQLHLLNNIVHLEFSGTVDSLDLVNAINHPEFKPSLARMQKVIYDFSGAQFVDVSYEDTKGFATIGKVEANFIDSLHGVIVLSCPQRRPFAEYYCQELAECSWQIDIVESLEEAFALLQE